MVRLVESGVPTKRLQSAAIVPLSAGVRIARKPLVSERLGAAGPCDEGERA